MSKTSFPGDAPLDTLMRRRLRTQNIPKGKDLTSISWRICSSRITHSFTLWRTASLSKKKQLIPLSPPSPPRYSRRSASLIPVFTDFETPPRPDSKRTTARLDLCLSCENRRRLTKVRTTLDAKTETLTSSNASKILSPLGWTVSPRRMHWPPNAGLGLKLCRLHPSPKLLQPYTILFPTPFLGFYRKTWLLWL